MFVTFIDDYFHSLAVGAIARPVTDRFKVSRAKLAYILDSTAAPMCVMMPVSSWGAYIITLVAGLLATYSIRRDELHEQLSYLVFINGVLCCLFFI